MRRSEGAHPFDELAERAAVAAVALVDALAVVLAVAVIVRVQVDGDELAASGCGHYFHKECVGQWVQVDSAEHAHQMRCPVCRFDVLEGVGAPS